MVVADEPCPAVEHVGQVLVPAHVAKLLVIVDAQGLAGMLIQPLAVALADEVAGPPSRAAEVAKDIPPPIAGKELPTVNAGHLGVKGRRPVEKQIGGEEARPGPG